MWPLSHDVSTDGTAGALSTELAAGKCINGCHSPQGSMHACSSASRAAGYKHKVHMQVILRLTPNAFREGLGEESIANSITRLMETFGLETEGDSPGSLDAVEVGWWQNEARSPLAVLQQLAKMCEDETESDADSGEVTVTAPKKIKALGVYNFDAECVCPAVCEQSAQHCYPAPCTSFDCSVTFYKLQSMHRRLSELRSYAVVPHRLSHVSCHMVVDAGPLWVPMRPLAWLQGN